jgi:hypothetical protein
MTRSRGGRGEQTGAMLNDGAVSTVAWALIVMPRSPIGQLAPWHVVTLGGRRRCPDYA